MRAVTPPIAGPTSSPPAADADADAPQSCGEQQQASNISADELSKQLTAANIVLPVFGGFAAFCADAGSEFVELDNLMDERLAAAPHPWTPADTPPRTAAVQGPAAARAVVLSPRSQQVLPLPLPIEGRLQELIGAPHNYEGFMTSGMGGARDSSGGSSSSNSSASGEEEGSTRGITAEEWRVRRELAAAEWVQRTHAKAAVGAAPLRCYLLGAVLPAITAGLAGCVVHQPDIRLAVLAARLLSAADSLDSAYLDPYSADVYAVQLAKVNAKAAREAARAEAAHAKSER